MKVKALIEYLKGMNQEASVELTRVFTYEPESGDSYTMRLDHPIIGLVESPDGDMLLVVEHVDSLRHFGNDLTRIDNNDVDDGIN